MAAVIDDVVERAEDALFVPALIFVASTEVVAIRRRSATTARHPACPRTPNSQ
jgi:hypothetical protein